LKGCEIPRPQLAIVQACKVKTKTVNRVFKNNLYEKASWLCGCQRLNSFLCFPCLIFGGEKSWTESGVTDIAHLSVKVKKHSLSQLHIRNVMQLNLLGQNDIRQLLDVGFRESVKQFNEKIRQNRSLLSRIIDCVRFCGAFELALRGHDESEHSRNKGVFRGLIDFVSEIDLSMKEHLEKATVFKGVSKTIQNDILDSILQVCVAKI
jgi:hypothetical protein